jgi:hypothetical protein
MDRTVAARVSPRLTRRVWWSRAVGCAAVLASVAAAHEPLIAQGSTQDNTPYLATKLIWRWRGIMNQTLEDARAFASEPVADAMEGFVSPGAVRAVQDKLKEDDLKKLDAVVQRFADKVVDASTRRPDGSRIVEEEAVEAGGSAVCPVYPFCGNAAK